MTTVDAVEYYWRPGCPFCMRLDRALERSGIPARRHNIWDDPEAAATVRSIANGNETVPTVVIGATSLVNPNIKAVIDALRDAAPHLVPVDDIPKRSLFHR